MESHKEFYPKSRRNNNLEDKILEENKQDTDSTPFGQDLQKFDNDQHHDQSNFFKGLQNLFTQVAKLSTPIKYEKSELKYDGKTFKPLLLLFGEMGNGKSTTGNFIIKDQL